ncbi:MAG: bile acid:sodium symporter family protein [Bacteroidales bacterium]|nr:bile acid:sodium symporter family protein [Bacteroidales bacterium]MBN2819348.1 bile acid:sodium symporter family protein [Bacteroidales bacterium]
MNDSLQVLDQIRLNFSEEGIFILNITLAFIMFGVALGIKIKNFKDVFLEPKLPIIGFVSQFFVLPAITFITVLALSWFISPTMAMGMILVAACPGGNVSNFMTALAKGNAALSVSLTAIATIAAIVFTPLNFDIYGGLYNKFLSNSTNQLLQPLDINPNKMFEAVFILLGIPLVLGMLFNHFFPKTTSKIDKPIRIASIVVFFGIVGVMLSNNFTNFMAYIKFIFLIVLAHNIIALLSGNLFARIWKIRGANRRAITIETGIQNSGLALALLFNPKIFPVELNNGGMAFIAAWWGVWHIISGLAIAGIWSLREPKVKS